MSCNFRVLITDRAWPDCDVERQILSQVDAEVVEAPNGDEETLVELARDVDAIATCWANVTEPVVREAKRCRIIARFGIGLDNIAVPVASELGIPVTYVPDYCVEEVADHTLALLLACARNVGIYHHQSKAGTYDRSAGPPLRRLSELTLGLVGFGRIGQTVFRKARALGMSVVAHSRSNDACGTGCRMLKWDELLHAADFVSLHCPANDETRGMMSATAIGKMKSSAWLINTSRGTLVNHADLWEAIQSEGIAGAALDVFDPEPPDLSQPLFLHERVIVTPHAAFLSRESLLELRSRTATQVAESLQGVRPEHVVNPHVYQD
ncbi:MAG: C-terminal binding protein [Planctomycetaceae bacterium]|jgi:D-3-phosphoglycerate dehydrogenase / 2-oxoglutarate reductase|nr:C-terminal binding protein [Planctomycetaceae bacterium]MBT6158162.1 C-terminal binding protein [Planctomycetaceae bacterium]MBT6487674.1 C-terminal binding protein [Planctomycetaceae bacterium]MBT6495710.1 C-terminal binding protein [Planctomycetaceae bacterium]